MSVYKIRFINNSRGRGLPDDFTLYSAPPAVRSSSGAVATSTNSFLTKSVNPFGGLWSIAINGAPLAVCGTSTNKYLEPTTKVNPTMFQLATLGSEYGSGSIHNMYNFNGDPAFQEDQSFTAPFGSYDIETANDFYPNQNWVGGYGLSHDYGQGQVATFSVDTNSRYTVAPSRYPKLFLAAFKSTPGELIDPNLIIERAVIDFGANPGQPNAIVTLDESGIYEVKYMNQAIFAMTTANSISKPQGSNTQLMQLRHQVKIMADMIDTALGISSPAPQSTVSSTSVGALQHDEVTLPYLRPDYICQVDWLEGPNQETKQYIADLLTISMARRGFYILDTVMGGKILTLKVWHLNRPSVEVVLSAWEHAYRSLSKMYLGKFVTNPRVEGILRKLNGDATTADDQLTASIFPPLDPAYVCSLSWLEGPSRHVKSNIFSKLAQAMRAKGYSPATPSMGGNELKVTMSHKRPSNLLAATKDWRDSWNILELEKMFTTRPQCELAYTIAGDGSVSTSSLPVMPPTYYCSLDWLEGPNVPTQFSIMQKVAIFMVRRGYNAYDPVDEKDKFSFTFSHDLPHDLSKVKADWDAAYDSLAKDLQKMWVTNPQCEDAFVIQAGNLSLAQLKLEDVAAQSDGISGVNGTQQVESIVNVQDQLQSQAQAQAQAQPVAPDVQTFSSMQAESIEAKKQRALALLRAEGLFGIDGLSVP